MTLPAIRVLKEVSCTFFSILELESNRLCLPNFLITAFHLYTSFTRNLLWFWRSTEISCLYASFLIFLGNIFDIFFRTLIWLLHLIFSKASSAEVTFSFVEDRRCIICFNLQCYGCSQLFLPLKWCFCW